MIQASFFCADAEAAGDSEVYRVIHCSERPPAIFMYGEFGGYWIQLYRPFKGILSSPFPPSLSLRRDAAVLSQCIGADAGEPMVGSLYDSAHRPLMSMVVDESRARAAVGGRPLYCVACNRFDLKKNTPVDRVPCQGTVIAKDGLGIPGRASPSS